MEIENQETGDVSSEQSTASSESPSSPETQSAASSQEATLTAEKPAPFHEHPRFQELIEQNRTFKQQQEQYTQQFQMMQQQLQAMQERYQAAQKPKEPSYDQLLDRLKGIDPEFAGFQAKIAEQLQQLLPVKDQIQQFQQWQQQQQLAQDHTTARSTLDRLYSDNKISQHDREDYEYRIKALAYENPKLGVKDLEQVFKSVHDGLSKRNEERRRKELASYTEQKSKDRTPTTQSGGAPAKIPGPNYGTSEGRVSAVLNALKASKST